MIQHRTTGGRAAPAGPIESPAGFAACWWLLAFWIATLSQAAEPATPPHRIGVLNDNYPFSYAGNDGRIEGFVVDLLAEIEKVTDLRVERQTGSTREINGAFEAGQLDLLQSYARSPERETFAAFSQPYLRMSGSIFIRKNGPALRTLADLKGRHVLVHPGSKGDQVLRAAGLADTIIYVDSVEESLRRLSAGEGDATLVGRLSGLATARRLGLKNIKPSGEPLYEVDYCFAVRKEHIGDILRRLDEGILILQQPGGAYAKVYRKWFGQLGGYTSTDVMIAVTTGLAVALLVALWAILRQRKLYRHIRAQADQLKAGEERYRSVFESTMDAILVLQPTAEIKNDFLVEQANPAAHRLFKVEALPWIGRKLSQLLPDGSALCTRLTIALAQKFPAPFEHECTSATAPLWLRVSVGRIGQRPLVVLANITDTRLAEARLKKQEDQLRQNQKLEAIGTLASGIAHDFNNILAAVVGNSELALLDLDKDHPARPCIDDILIGSVRARKLVRQILTFSRKSETLREIVAIGSIVEETLGLLRATTSKSVELAYTRPHKPHEVEADPTQLHQVLLNLCTNAIHALRDKTGRIEITEELVELDETDTALGSHLPPGRYVHLSVRDNGCGMPPEIMQRIFEPFYTTKPTGEGTGLGLSVVHGILQSHGGDITVYSKPGQGTVFHLYLPASKQPATVETRPPLLIPGAGQRILVVDDEATITHATCRLLEKIGYATTAFLDPRDALAAFRQNPTAHHLVLCDLTMPGLTGLELAEEIARTTPFIIMSGYISEEDKQRALSLNVCHLISKPLDHASLASLIARSLTPGRN